MARLNCSFLIRCWWLQSSERRIEMHHIQSGGRVRAASLIEGMEWMDVHCGDRVVEQASLAARLHQSEEEVVPDT
jgi:hypothetical protein